MLAVPPALLAQFEERLRNKTIPERSHGLYKKWLRYYPDFCGKCDFPDARKESLPHFLGKLEKKRQTKAQREQAAQAISVYYDILDGKDSTEDLEKQQANRPAKNAPFENGRSLPNN